MTYGKKQVAMDRGQLNFVRSLRLHAGWLVGGVLATLSVYALSIGLVSTSVAQESPPDTVPTVGEPPADVLQSEAARVAAAAKAIPSVVAVFSEGGSGGGSGVVISPDGYALTNFHVVQPCGDHMQCGMADGKLYDAVVVGIDPVGDVALIKLFGRDDFPTAEIANSDDVRVGEWCFAMGNPFLLATDFTPTVTFGVVSGVNRYQYPAGTLLEYPDCIQTDAAINPGNSGGPLFDGQGRLIGINGRGSFEKRGRVNVGVGYAISINQVKNFLGYLKSGRIIDHATLGAVVSSWDDGKVVVSNILEDSDAYRRGLRMDDEIVRFAGRPIRTVNAFKNALGVLPRDWRVPLSYRRDGKTYDILVRLTGVHRKDELIAKTKKAAEDEGPPMPGDPDDTPDEDGKEEKEKESKDRKKSGPPDKEAKKPAAKKMPDIVKQHFEKGAAEYVNYFFNRRNQDRLWKGLLAKGDFAPLQGTWTFSGTNANGNFKLELDNKGGSIELPTGDSHFNAETDGLDEKLNPPDSGGMMFTLWLWRKYLVNGQAKFGRMQYIGTAPLTGQTELVDVMDGISQGVTSRFYFDPREGTLLCIEMFPADNMDPCEIYFSDYQPLDGRLLPRTIEVRHGDSTFGRFSISDLKLQAAGSGEGAKK
ncbi:MAG: trypsin-like peptidase domain-containing protein [Planctomycetota bacterium]|nr:trypsin-like peptidase domain-containing protein [Planctomycetota bacterium]